MKIPHRGVPVTEFDLHFSSADRSRRVQHMSSGWPNQPTNAHRLPPVTAGSCGTRRSATRGYYLFMQCIDGSEQVQLVHAKYAK